MESYRRNTFFVTTPAILKVVEMAVLVTSLVLFLVSNNCQGFATYVAVYALPIAVCIAFTIVSYITAILMTASGSNPLATPTWIKGDAVLNVMAALLMVVGSVLTLTRSACSNTPLTVTGIALGFISAGLFACSGACTYLLLVHHEEKLKGRQSANRMDGHTATPLAAIS